MINQLQKVNALLVTDGIGLVKKADYNTKICEIRKKILDHVYGKYAITQEFNKLTAYNFKARLTHEKVAIKGGIADLLKKTDFYEKIKSLSKTIT